MKTPKMDPDEMLKAMAEEAVKQHKHIRTAIRDLTIKALQMREVSLKQVNTVVRKVTEGVNLGVNQERLDVEKTLSDAFAGMDEALLKVVEANKVALGRLTDSGASFEESIVKKGLKEVEALEEQFLDGIKAAARKASDQAKEQWKTILGNKTGRNRYRRTGGGNTRDLCACGKSLHELLTRGELENHALVRPELRHAGERRPDRPLRGARTR
jgi:hypothetical protein